MQQVLLLIVIVVCAMVMCQAFQTFLYLVDLNQTSLIPLAAQSKVWVYGIKPAENVSSNPDGDVEYCVLSGRGLWEYSRLRLEVRWNRSWIP